MPTDADLDRIIHSTLFGEAVGNTDVAALLADGTGQYVAVNDAACRLTGYARTALTAFRSGQLGADERSRQIYTDISRGRRMQGQKTIRCHDGSLVTCRYWALPTVVARTPHHLLLLWQPASA